MTKAGHNFVCVCCLEKARDDQAERDSSIGGPICPYCKFLLLAAESKLIKAGIRRPLDTGDITKFNRPRFKEYGI